MKKILLAGLIAFTMVALAGSAAAWNIDINAHVTDADVDISASASDATWDGFYGFDTTAGVDGNGDIKIWGSSCKDKLTTKVSGEGELYATQTMLVTGCLVDCGEEPCNECPDYVYGAASGAAIDGEGSIKLKSDVLNRRGDHTQKLKVYGAGDFTAGMAVAYQIEGQEPVAHAMGATGVNVNFCAYGATAFDASSGEADGFFTAYMWFHDPGCVEDDCQPCPGCK